MPKLIKCKDGTYSVQIIGKHGKKIQSPTGCTSKVAAYQVVKESGIAEAEIATKAGILTRDVITKLVCGKNVSMQEAVAGWKEWIAGHLEPNTVENSTIALNAWIRDCKLDGIKPGGITPKQIDDYINDPASQRKASTRAVNLSAIKSFFSYATANSICFSDPSAKIKIKMRNLTHLQKETRPKEVFTEFEERMIKRALESDLRSAVEKLDEYMEKGATPRLFEQRQEIQDKMFWRFAFTTGLSLGLRLGDICQLEWDCFNESKKTVVVWTDKRDARVALEYGDEVAGCLPPKTPNGRHLFPRHAKVIRDTRKRAIFSVQFQRLMGRLGISGKSFHCLRHTYVTRCVAAGIPMPHISEAVGHSSTAITEVYNHHNKPAITIHG